jgi:hypothetical protein
MKRPKTSPRLDRLFVFAICLRGLIIAMIAHLLLAVGKTVELIRPESPVGEVISLVGYCLLAGLLTVKVYRVMGTNGRKRPMLEASIIEVTTEQAEKPEKQG